MKLCQAILRELKPILSEHEGRICLRVFSVICETRRKLSFRAHSILGFEIFLYDFSRYQQVLAIDKSEVSGK